MDVDEQAFAILFEALWLGYFGSGCFRCHALHCCVFGFGSLRSNSGLSETDCHTATPGGKAYLGVELKNIQGSLAVDLSLSIAPPLSTVVHCIVPKLRRPPSRYHQL